MVLKQTFKNKNVYDKHFSLRLVCLHLLKENFPQFS